MADRYSGNPNDRVTDREGARLGQKRSEDAVPKQGAANRVAGAATYRIGPPTRPHITWDNGFLDRFSPRAPTVSDYAELAKWKGKLEAGELLRSDLTDALAAYRHFLDGRGRDRVFSYERYIRNDKSGRQTLRNAILSIQWGVLQLWNGYGKRSFSLTGSAISCAPNSMFPYPATENWQKTIGGHVIWLSGSIKVSGGLKPEPALNKAGSHSFRGRQLQVAKDGAIRVAPGDTLSFYSGALYGGNLSHVNDFGRKQGNMILTIANANLIRAGEVLYHIPTHSHYLAISGSNNPAFSLEMVLHAEDRYNFNPGQQDIATGIADSANGRFEITGLGHQFTQTSTLRRAVAWSGYSLGVASAGGSDSRERQPQNNRQVRNRI